MDLVGIWCVGVDVGVGEKNDMLEFFDELFSFLFFFFFFGKGGGALVEEGKKRHSSI